MLYSTLVVTLWTCYGALLNYRIIIIITYFWTTLYVQYYCTPYVICVSDMRRLRWTVRKLLAEIRRM